MKINSEIKYLLLFLLVKGHESYAEYEVEATAYDQGEEVATVRGKLNEPLAIEINNKKLWSPDNPFLYDLEVSLIHNNQQVDEVRSYFGMREIRLGKDEEGIIRLFLNDQPLFHFGTLDQGFWPDGLYTAPTEEAMKRAVVLGEFGGQAYVDKDHLWINDFSKAPQHYKTSPLQSELVKKYDELISKLVPLKEKGLAAAVYTQTTDVESEVNGLMTYDRKVLKFDKAHMKKMHDQLIGK